MIDTYLSRLTRRASHVRGSERLIRPLSRLFSSFYADRPDRWVVLSELGGAAGIQVDRGSRLGSRAYWFGSDHGHELGYVRRNLSGGMCFIDVGAGLGELTLLAAEQLPSGRVLAFESNPELRAALQRNLERGGLTNVQVFDDPSSATTGERGGAASGLDRVVEAQGLSRVDMVHVAARGGPHVLDVLDGARSMLERFRPELAIEVDEAALRAGGRGTSDILDRLEEQGYRYYGFQPRAAHGSGELTRERVLHRAQARPFHLLCRPG